jgi:hypothetical protein
MVGLVVKHAGQACSQDIVTNMSVKSPVVKDIKQVETGVSRNRTLNLLIQAQPMKPEFLNMLASWFRFESCEIRIVLRESREPDLVCREHVTQHSMNPIYTRITK